MASYNTSGVTSYDPRNLGGSEGYGPSKPSSNGLASKPKVSKMDSDMYAGSKYSPTSGAGTSKAKQTYSSAAAATANDDNVSYGQSYSPNVMSAAFTSAGAVLPPPAVSKPLTFRDYTGGSLYDSDIFKPKILPDNSSDINNFLGRSAIDDALSEALGPSKMPEIYLGQSAEEPEPNIDMSVLQGALQPESITVKEIEVKAGDTLTGIAAANNVPVQDVIDANPQIKNPDLIRPGEKVTLPSIISTMGKLLKTATDPEAPAPVSEDPDREFYQSGMPIEERVFEGEDPRNLGVAETGEGLMSDPRKLGGAEGYGKLTKNMIEGTDKEELKETQSRLKALGFYESAVDGLTGPSTKSAIKTFQHKNGLEVTGIADKATRLKLAQPENLVAQEKPKRTLLSFISKGEGGYGAANNGTSKLAKKFSIVDGYYSDTYSKPLTEMTVNELMNAQVGTTGKTTEELLRMNPESTSAQRNRDVFAVGAYQIIPKTMWDAVRKGAIDGGTVFNPKTQDKIAIDFLAGSDRTKLRDFLGGNPNVSVDDAMLDLAKQWASAPVPKTQTITWTNEDGSTGSKKVVAGKSYYGSGNKSQHTVAETKAMLLQARDENVL